MLVVITVTASVKMPVIDNQHYDKNIVYVKPLYTDAINGLVMVTANEEGCLRAGYTLTADGYFYMTSTGDWVFRCAKTHNGKPLISAGGNRNFIPWSKIGINSREDIYTWTYVKTKSRELHPMDIVFNSMTDSECVEFLVRMGVTPTPFHEVNLQRAIALGITY